PFTLTGTATDTDGDVLTYCWEQDDNASSSQTGSSSVASPAKNPGPNWISFQPTTSPTRLFPQLSTILAGSTVSGPLPGGDAGANTEALSSVSRDLKFRLTVRDNQLLTTHATGDTISVGQIASADVTVSVSNIAGPFSISSHNTASSWSIGDAQPVTWDVSNTTSSPISCSTVNILLSIDSGQTFPYVLASATPNDGTETVTVPLSLNPSNKARIKVEAVGNIFFDINNANISLVNQPSCAAPSGLTSSGLDTSSATVSWTAVNTANSYLLNYKLSTSASWTSLATSNTTEQLGNLNSSSVYDWRVKTICGIGDSSTFSVSQFTTLTPPCKSAYDTSANNTTSGAKTIPLNTDIKGLISPSGDIDNYKFSLGSSGTLTLTLTTLPANYNLKLLNSTGTQLALSQNNGTANELITYPVSTASTVDFYAQVFGKGNANNANSCYTLKAAFQPTAKIGQKIQNDFTGNHESTYSLASGILKIFPNPVHSLLQLYGRGWTTPVEVEVYQLNGQKAFRQRLQPGWMTIDVSRLASGLYLLRIKTPSGEVQEHKFLKQ
ncbi:MAG: T9SS type A sorting domain-containing protein, partial [Chitinophagaceae bacterium]